MRISDWSSDVCSSDLGGDQFGGGLFALVLDQLLRRRRRGVGGERNRDLGAFAVERPVAIGTQVVAGEVAGDLAQPGQEAGRVLQALEVLPGREEGVLGDVLAGDRKRTRLNSSH